jgi:hypothetical protein
MSVVQIAASILALPPAERAKLIGWLDAHRHELADETEVSPEVRAELELRQKEANDHPELLEEFEEKDLERMFKEIADPRSQKPSAR